MSIDIVGVDGDDTLWHSEGHYHVTQQRFAEMLEPWSTPSPPGRPCWRPNGATSPCSATA